MKQIQPIRLFMVCVGLSITTPKFSSIYVSSTPTTSSSSSNNNNSYEIIISNTSSDTNSTQSTAHNDQQQLANFNSVSSSPMRVGTQLGGSSSSSSPSSSSGGQDESKTDVVESRVDLPAPKSTASTAAAASNHQNYPIEPYPSASYTTLVHHSTSNPTGQQQQVASINTLLNRDHHQLALMKPGDFNDNDFGYNHNLKNLNDFQLASTQISPNHNYASLTPSSSSTNIMNANLIQNLTASLFPVKQLSNVTLLSLSELLNKTRQQSQQSSHLATNGYKPNYYNQATHQNQMIGIPGNGPTLSNYLDTLLGDPPPASTLHLLDYLRQPANNQFGFREPSSVARFQAQNGNQQQQNSYTKTPSNLYNTYLPFKDNQLTPTTTNGQALKMAAASLYDSYLDHTAAQQSSHQAQTRPQAQQAYQFIQHHNSNNGINHLDKIVYHSTPFRPSIVSPPNSEPFKGNSNSAWTSTLSFLNNNYNKTGYNQRPAKEHDSNNKLAAGGSIGMPNSSDSNQSDSISANGQATYNATKNSGYSSSLAANRHQVAPGLRLAANIDHHHNEFFDFDHPVQGVQDNSSMLFDQHQTSSSSRNHSSPGAVSMSATKTQLSALPTNAPQQSMSSIAPQMLFDLYEREIDNQIREALYSDHYEHFHQAPPDVVMSTPTSSMSSSSSNQLAAQASWPYDDLDGANYNWLSGQHSSSTPASSTSASSYNIRPATSSSHLSTTTTTTSGNDPLVAALQELPTFSASDLQPILPTGPAYSVSLSPQTAPTEPVPMTDPSTALASLASHLYPLIGQQQPNLVNYFNELNHNNDQFSWPPVSANANQIKQPTSPTPTSSPGILFKLNSGQISSILTSPFSHLYANLPRYRYYKAKQQQQPQQQTSSSSPVGSILPANSLISKQFWASLAGSTKAPQADNSQKESSQSTGNISKQQAAAVAAASAAANLIAASGQPLTPLQVALIQAQAATSAYLHSDPLLEHEQSNRYTTESSSQQQHQQPFVGGLAGGGISPLVWRGIFAPIHWARKQTSVGQTNSNGSHLGATTTAAGNHQTAQATNTYHQLARPLSFPLMSSLLGATGNNFLNWPPAANQQLASGTSTIATKQNVKPRLKIKVLKIPVAFYDNSPAPSSSSLLSTGASNSETNPDQLLGHSLGLMPAHLQPSQTASLLASLPCAFHNHHPNAITSAVQVPYMTKQYYPSPSTKAQTTLASANQQQPPTPAATSTNQPMQQQSSTRTQTNNSGSQGHERPFQMQYFTDINQPNDLQVSPTTTVMTTMMANTLKNSTSRLVR